MVMYFLKEKYPLFTWLSTAKIFCPHTVEHPSRKYLGNHSAKLRKNLRHLFNLAYNK